MSPPIRGRRAQAAQAHGIADRFDCGPEDRTFPGQVRCLVLAAILDATETQPDLPDVGGIYWSLERASEFRGVAHGGSVFDAAAAELGIPYHREAGLYFSPAEARAWVSQ